MRSLALIISFTFIQISYSQTYTPFISTADSSDQWFDYKRCGVNGGGSCIEYFRTIYSIDGDTIINGINYAQLSAIQQHAEEPGFFSPSPCPAWDSVYTFFAGGIREANKQVFFFDAENDMERVIYDFNLAVGDTVPDPNPVFTDPYQRIITSVDSILIGSDYRKRYNLPDLESTHAIIEGIGSTDGLFPNMVQFISCGRGLYCYLENDVSLFPDPGASCQLNLGLEPQELGIEIYPNPARDQLTIESETGTTVSVELINGFGQTMQSQSFTGSSNIVDISEIASGIYFVKISVDGKVGVQKIIIE